MTMTNYYEGYDVPQNIKEISSNICKRFAITGICDPMYISNVIGVTSNIGDGKGNFHDDNITNIQEIAERLQSAYGCNILKSEIPELIEIIETGNINLNLAIPGIENFIERIEEEKRHCDEWRIDYLNRVISSLNEALQELKL